MAMNVGQLKKLLEGVPDDIDVITFGGDEMHHMATGVEIRTSNIDIGPEESVGPFLEIVSRSRDCPYSFGEYMEPPRA